MPRKKNRYTVLYGSGRILKGHRDEELGLLLCGHQNARRVSRFLRKINENHPYWERKNALGAALKIANESLEECQ